MCRELPLTSRRNIPNEDFGHLESIPVFPVRRTDSELDQEWLLQGRSIVLTGRVQPIVSKEPVQARSLRWAG